MYRIIGHRGAAGLELENTIPSIKKALALGVDAIEFDVRRTKDNKIVLCHDPDLSRVSDDTRKVKDLTYKQLRAIPLHNGEKVPLLTDVLKLVGEVPVIIELKVGKSAKKLLKIIDQFPNANISVASFKHQEAHLLKQLRPSLPVYFAEHTSPLEVVQKAKAAGADGLDLNFWLLNPLVYWLARRHNLKIMVYTVNNRFYAWFLSVLYPNIGICTNYPNKFNLRRR